METNSPYSLSQLQQFVGNSIRTNSQLQNVWVTAEMSDLRVAGGHCYMELLEKDALGTTCAKMRAMIWSSQLPGIRKKFLGAAGREIGSGLKVMVRGSVNHHNIYGLSFTITDIDPSYTLGDMERLRREIIQKLTSEGIINRNKNLQFPRLPQRIAIISAGGAAGYGDFINQLTNNTDGFKFYHILFPAVMQGDRTSGSVRSALDRIASTIDCWDCVIIIRGGGATTDLNGFDDYDLAKAVALFPIPVIVGIGHERDRTVLDEIACIRCKTPTAVAAFLIDSMRLAYQSAIDPIRKIALYASDALKGEKYRLSNFRDIIPLRAESCIAKAEKRIADITNSFERSLLRKLKTQQERIQNLSHSIQLNASRISTKEDERLRLLTYRYSKALTDFTSKPRLQLENLGKIINILSPQNTIKRGYSLTLINGKAVRSSNDLKKGDVITTKLIDGEIQSTVN